MSELATVIFGEVLWDCFPDGQQILGGAPFNVAWHLQAFGQTPFLISRVGDDAAGEAILAAMRAWGMTTDGIQVDPTYGTGRVTIQLHQGEPSYDIEHPKAYDHIDANLLPALPPRALLYHGSLAVRHPVSRQSLEALKTQLSPVLFYDVNLRDPWWQPATIQAALQTTTWLKLNEAELKALVPQDETSDHQLEWLFEQGNMQFILLTAGKAGASLRQRDGDRLTIKPQQNIQVVDTVGAGDAFCSVMLLGIARGWPLAQTLERAQAFASAIVGIQGATTTNPTFYEPFQTAWL